MAGMAEEFTRDGEDAAETGFGEERGRARADEDVDGGVRISAAQGRQQRGEQHDVTQTVIDADHEDSADLGGGRPSAEVTGRGVTVK